MDFVIRPLSDYSLILDEASLFQSRSFAELAEDLNFYFKILRQKGYFVPTEWKMTGKALSDRKNCKSKSAGQKWTLVQKLLTLLKIHPI